MNCCPPERGRLLAPILLLALTVSCGRGDLPEVPEFDTLGFAETLGAVRQQVRDVYDSWREEPFDADRNGRLGMHLWVYEKNGAAEVLFRRARALAPGDFRWTYYLAFLLAEMGRSDEAVGVFREVLEIAPDNAQARLRLAELLLQDDKTAESRELYESVSIEFPERVEGWLGLGKALHRAGDLEAAAAALRRARIVGPQYGEVHYALALVLNASGDPEGAARELAAYERTARNKIRPADPLLQQVTLLHAGDAPHINRGSAQHFQGQYLDAAQSFRAALEINPVSQPAWLGLLSSEVGLDDIDAAGATYRSAIEAGVAYARFHLTYGQALLDWGQTDAARAAIGKAIELDPQYAEALAAMGELELGAGANETAVEQFRLALRARPNDRTIRFSLGQALNAAGRFTEAATMLEPLTTDNALDQSATLYEVAVAYDGLGRTSDATAALLRAREAARRSTDTSVAARIDALLARLQSEDDN